MVLHVPKYDFKIDKIVRIKKNLGINPSYKPKKFHGEGVILEIHSNNRVLINFEGLKKKIVSMSRNKEFLENIFFYCYQILSQ